MSIFNFGGKKQDMSDHLEVTIEDTGTILYEGPAYALSSTNEKGPFDILPYHNNFIALVQKYITIHKTKEEKIDLQIETGVLRQRRNKVEVFVGVERLNQQAESALPAGALKQPESKEKGK